MNKKTKVIATYGPACEKPNVLPNLIKAGTDLIRINASHNADPEKLKQIVTKVRQASKKLEKRVGIFLDLQGPKIRVGTFKKEKITLKSNSTVSIYTKDLVGDEKQFSVDYPYFCKDVKVDDPIFIDDGKIKGIVQSVSDDHVICKITTGGVVSSNKGVNLPFTKLSMSAFTKKDEKDALTAIKVKCDYIALSFVSSAYDVISFRRFLDENGGEGFKIIAKIERQQAVDNLVEIVQQADAVMVARGDLGVEIGNKRVPRIQKQIIQTCNKYIKPVIVATQMLESMINSLVATRAEVSDIANAIYDHCDAVMLSAETAVGIDPVNAVTVMAEICEEADNHLVQVRKDEITITKRIFAFHTTATSFCRAADQIAEENSAKVIMAFTSSGNTPLIASKLNSLFPIIAPTDSEEVCNQLCLFRGVIPIMMPKLFSEIYRWTDMISLAVKQSEKQGYVEKGDCVVVTAGIPIGRSNGINSIRIINV